MHVFQSEIIYYRKTENGNTSNIKMHAFHILSIKLLHFKCQSKLYLKNRKASELV